VVQGLGGGTAVVSLFVAVAAFPGHLRPKILAALSACWVLPSIVGPPLAGLLTETLSWRWVFWALIPLVPIPLALALPGVSRMTGSGAPSRWSRIGLALLLALGVAGVQYGGQLASTGSASGELAAAWGTAGVLAVGGLVVALLCVRRFLPAGTLRLRRGLPSVVAMRGFLAGAFFASEAYIPLMLVEHRGWSVTFAGMALMGAALGWATGSWLQGGRPKSLEAPQRRERASRYARYGGVVVAVGLLVTGLGVISTGDLSVPSLVTPLGWLLAGLGMGMGMSAVSVLLFELSPVEQRGANSAALQMCDQLGSITVLAVVGAIYSVGRATLSGSVLFACIFVVTLAVAVGSGVVATRVLPTFEPARARPPIRR
ncbi:MAG: MFS transporter, partial [Pseudonocardia sp.]